MKTSTDRILTTHVGSIPRPENVRALLRARLGGQAIDEAELAARAAEAVAEVVRRQAEVGLDIISDGEMSKTSFLAYTDERLTGFVPAAANDPSAAPTGAGGAWARRVESRREWRAFREYYTEYLPREMPLASAPTVCEGPIAYKGQALLQKDLATLKAAMLGLHVAEAFVPAIAPAMVGRGQNRYYPTEDAYVFAIAEALKTEYRAIVDAGFILQIDDPGMAENWDAMDPSVTIEEYRVYARLCIEALNHALDGIPEDRVRYHMCWGSWHGPHLTDVPLRDIVDLLLTIRAGAFSLEAGNVRHEHEWKVWRDVKLPDGKMLIPGVVSHATNVVEHPELVADRIVQFAQLVGRENVVAGTDCGLGGRVHPSLAWAKLQALVEGAALASKQLFS